MKHCLTCGCLISSKHDWQEITHGTSDVYANCPTIKTVHLEWSVLSWCSSCGCLRTRKAFGSKARYRYPNGGACRPQRANVPE